MFFKHPERCYQKCYTYLLLFYPKSFYEQFGEGMKQTFNDVLRAQLESKPRLLRMAIWMFCETLASIARENFIYLFMKNTSILRVALVTILVLLIPLLANFPWTLSDFVVMGSLIFGVGIAYEFMKNRGRGWVHRAAVGAALGTTFLLTWVNLAVGLIGGEHNPANALYFAVPIVGLIGAVLTRFEPRGMARTLLAMMTVQILIPLIAFVVWHPDSTQRMVHTIGVNLFFTFLFAGSALLFRYSSSLHPNLHRS